MKRVLLGFTALAAAASLLGERAAAGGFEVEIGGHYEGAAGAVLSESFNAVAGASARDLRDRVFKQDIEIDMRAAAALDNGLTVEATVEMVGQSDREDQIDAAYASLGGAFGEVRFGDTEEAYAQLCYLVPSASEMFGADSPNFNFSNAGIAGFDATNDTCNGVDGNATKLVYFSPTVGGFHFALSYAPDGTEDSRNTVAGAGTRPSNDDGQNSENLSLAATFARDIGGVGLVVGGGATFSFDNEGRPGGETARGYNGYIQVAFGGLTIGGATELRVNFDDGADQWVYGAGAVYAWDGWAVGLGWTRGDYEDAVGANGVGPFDASHDIVSATTSRELGPGISIDGVVEYSDYRGDEAAGPDYRGLAVGLGLLINF